MSLKSSPFARSVAPSSACGCARIPAGFCARLFLCAAHEVADRDVRRDFDEHMDVVTRQDTVDDRHVHLGAHLADDLANPQADLPAQHFIPIFRCPDEMVAMTRKIKFDLVRSLPFALSTTRDTSLLSWSTVVEATDG